MSSSAPNIAAQLRELIALWGDPTQEEVAKRFGVRREYISRVLNGLEPSLQFQKALGAMLEGSRHGRPAPIVTETQPRYGAGSGELMQQIRREFDSMLAVAGGNVAKLGWLLIEVRGISGRLRSHMTAEESRQAEEDLRHLEQLAAESEVTQQKERRHAG